jgi:hypothetical protein
MKNASNFKVESLKWGSFLLKTPKLAVTYIQQQGKIRKRLDTRFRLRVYFKYKNLTAKELKENRKECKVSKNK